MRFIIALTILLPLALAAPGSLDQRQTPCAFPEYKTELVSDSDPHQNFYHIQLSENNDCGEATECSVGHEVSKSYTVGWFGGVSGFNFFSGGFEVQESYTTGKTYTCTGKTGEIVWIEYPGCPTGQPIEKKWAVIKAPNKDNAGGNYDCRIGPENCRTQSDNYWA
ncbi:hypothetical protein B0T18DRAFT_394482 [Schizothecium vesticola]|uniref:Uncharacterized protein n=1 Tax=Schizothecium vesticola TaxID=314040 RepID=A0AA40EIH3_9PEZI|nr:hypothetical protein B0T18DRAFT_394482 [Schizothecium vesticola]